ncbi:MAG: ribosome biogenesis GTPase YlqF [Clostridia bacterium]|nr:ribosome biogenesis GTPase YlqF [Clostridia bacterium]
MPTENIQWFPGHMARTRRLISENLKKVDAVIEILDARIPLSSRNPEIRRLTEGKPRLILLNKASLADPAANREWIRALSGQSTACILTDCQSGAGVSSVIPAVRELLKDRLDRYESKGMKGRNLYVMVTGIPNVGKSTFINRMAGSNKAKAEDRPGVTKDVQWYTTGKGVVFLDMPGVLWPKFENQTVAEHLAMTGAIKDESQDTEHLAVRLCATLAQICPAALEGRYKLEPTKGRDPYEIFLEIGRKRGFLIGGGEINTERTAAVLLDEFRGGRIGLITLDEPPRAEAEEGVPNAGLQS